MVIPHSLQFPKIKQENHITCVNVARSDLVKINTAKLELITPITKSCSVFSNVFQGFQKDQWSEVEHWWFLLPCVLVLYVEQTSTIPFIMYDALEAFPESVGFGASKRRTCQYIHLSIPWSYHVVSKYIANTQINVYEIKLKE